MNIIAIDIGNTNIKIALFLDAQEQPIKVIKNADRDELELTIANYWDQIPISKRSTQGKRDGVIVMCSSNPKWSELVKEIVDEELGEKVLEIGFEKDIPIPIKLGVPYPAHVGVDRAVAAAAAYFVVKDSVVVADFGTATTIDLVDEDGIFRGGLIAPGLATMAKSLNDNIPTLPDVEIKKPLLALGQDTNEAINCGILYANAGLLEHATRKYAEDLGKWPQTIVTGQVAQYIKDDCDFVDNWVPSLVIKGIVLAYKKYIEDKSVE